MAGMKSTTTDGLRAAQIYLEDAYSTLNSKVATLDGFVAEIQWQGTAATMFHAYMRDYHQKVGLILNDLQSISQGVAAAHTQTTRANDAMEASVGQLNGAMAGMNPGTPGLPLTSDVPVQDVPAEGGGISGGTLGVPVQGDLGGIIGGGVANSPSAPGRGLNLL
ncbi:MAG: WXG100 family type VII secretion target [Streptomyces sp.]|uniref:WXG100 family type VII secretion target n=1 Tax=Streptomyces sp. TaxID=1931 RepID=UPI0025EC828E|nr:WXG100 family type VII secretion target [Streptomyces sp.]MBW8792677.1 WXG100 family type VII secretion target [Streptomyces sp.]